MLTNTWENTYRLSRDKGIGQRQAEVEGKLNDASADINRVAENIDEAGKTNPVLHVARRRVDIELNATNRSCPLTEMPSPAPAHDGN